MVDDVVQSKVKVVKSARWFSKFYDKIKRIDLISPLLLLLLFLFLGESTAFDEISRVHCRFKLSASYIRTFDGIIYSKTCGSLLMDVSQDEGRRRFK